MFYWDKIDGKKILKSDYVTNAFFTTKDICICDKSNIDNTEIIKNREIISNHLGINSKNLIMPEQTHSDNIEIITSGKTYYPETDALILTEKQYAIFLNFADCTPIIFYDAKQNIGAIAHAGWRGTAQKIAVKTALKLINDFNSRSDDIVALIGPAICEKCYEVGDEVIDKLKSTVTNFDGLYNNRHVDLKGINRRQLNDIGIVKIDVCSYCSCCDNEYFYSYRKEHGTALRHSAVLKLG